MGLLYLCLLCIIAPAFANHEILNGTYSMTADVSIFGDQVCEGPLRVQFHSGNSWTFTINGDFEIGSTCTLTIVDENTGKTDDPVLFIVTGNFKTGPGTMFWESGKLSSSARSRNSFTVIQAGSVSGNTEFTSISGNYFCGTRTVSDPMRAQATLSTWTLMFEPPVSRTCNTPLSTGAIVGIIVGVGVLLSVIAFVFRVMLARK